MSNDNPSQPLPPNQILSGTSEEEARVVLPEDMEAAARTLAANARAKMLADPRVQSILASAAAAEQAKRIAPTLEATIAPGVERWPVKTGSDPDAANVDLQSIQSTTVEQMALLNRPADMDLSRPSPAYQSHRAVPTETTVWQIEAEITAYKLESDGDYHLVIRSDNSYEMIAEIPDPDPAFVDSASPFATGISSARQQFDQQFSGSLAASPNFQNASQRARLTGIGFFDIAHGQRGFAQTNGIELHPVIDIVFLQSAGSGGPPAAAASVKEIQPSSAAAPTTKRIVITLDLTNI